MMYKKIMSLSHKRILRQADTFGSTIKEMQELKDFLMIILIYILIKQAQATLALLLYQRNP